MFKVCSKCGETKHATGFYKHAGRRDGLQSYCKACARLTHAAWCVAHPEKAKANVDKWVASNRDKHKSSTAAWFKANPGKAKAYTAKWCAANKDKKKAYNAKWYSANPEARRIHDNNRRAREHANGGRLSRGLEKRLFKLQRGKCACGCKQPLGDDFHMDHRTPLALGGSNTDDNIQLLRAECNLQKHAKHPIDFMQSKGFLL